MPAYLSSVAVESSAGAWKRAFPNDAAGIYRSVVCQNSSNAVMLRQASATNNQYAIDTGVTQPLGVMESADLEVRCITTNTPTVYFFGSHPSW